MVNTTGIYSSLSYYTFVITKGIAQSHQAGIHEYAAKAGGEFIQARTRSLHFQHLKNEGSS